MFVPHHSHLIRTKTFLLFLYNGRLYVGNYNRVGSLEVIKTITEVIKRLNDGTDLVVDVSAGKSLHDHLNKSLGATAVSFPNQMLMSALKIFSVVLQQTHYIFSKHDDTLPCLVLSTFISALLTAVDVLYSLH